MNERRDNGKTEEARVLNRGRQGRERRKNTGEKGRDKERNTRMGTVEE